MKKAISIRLDEPVYETLRLRAFQTRQSMASMAAKFISAGLNGLSLDAGGEPVQHKPAKHGKN